MQRTVFSTSMAALVAAVMASLLMLGVPTAHAKPGGSETIHLYLDTANCSDSNDGSAKKPLCTLRGASNKLNALRANGKARGDVFVRFKTGKNKIYKAKPNAGAEPNTFTFAPEAGRRVHLVPEGYTSRSAMKNRSVADYAVIQGNGGEGAENRHGIVIAPDKNRGGSFLVSGITIRDFKNGILLDGGVHNKDAKDPAPYDQGVVRGVNAPINNPIVEYNNFTRIGDPYAKTAGKAMGVFRIWNTTDGEFNHNRITDVKGGNELHVVYGYLTANLAIRNNKLENIDAGSTFRYRHGGNWLVADNPLPKGGVRDNYYGHVSEWFRGSSFAGEDRYAECKAPVARVENMGDWTILAPKGTEKSWCKNAARVYPPAKLVGQQTANDRYYLTWDAASTHSSKVKIRAYEVYVNGQHVGTRKASAPEFTINSTVMKKANIKPGEEFSYAVVAVSDQGTRSSLTANRSFATFDPTVSTSGQNVSSSVDTHKDRPLDPVSLGTP